MIKKLMLGCLVVLFSCNAMAQNTITHQLWTGEIVKHLKPVICHPDSFKAWSKIVARAHRWYNSDDACDVIFEYKGTWYKDTLGSAACKRLKPFNTVKYDKVTAADTLLVSVLVKLPDGAQVKIDAYRCQSFTVACTIQKYIDTLTNEIRDKGGANCDYTPCRGGRGCPKPPTYVQLDKTKFPDEYVIIGEIHK